MFNNPYTWNWIQTNHVEWIAQFDSQQHLYTVSFKHITNVQEGFDFWEASFGVDQNVNQKVATKEFKAPKILSTVVDVFRDMMMTTQPNKILFFTNFGKLDRSSTYQTLIRKNIFKPYKVHIEVMHDKTKFVIYKT